MGSCCCCWLSPRFARLSCVQASAPARLLSKSASSALCGGFLFTRQQLSQCGPLELAFSGHRQLQCLERDAFSQQGRPGVVSWPELCHSVPHERDRVLCAGHARVWLRRQLDQQFHAWWDVGHGWRFLSDGSAASLFAVVHG